MNNYGTVVEPVCGRVQCSSGAEASDAGQMTQDKIISLEMKGDDGKG